MTPSLFEHLQAVYRECTARGHFRLTDGRVFPWSPGPDSPDPVAAFVRCAEAYLAFDRVVSTSYDGTVTLSGHRTFRAFPMGATAAPDRLPPANAFAVTGGSGDQGLPPAQEVPVTRG